MSDLGARLRELRQEFNLSQAAVADEIGVRTHSVWKYEAGRQIPKSYRLGKLAALFGVTLESLVELIEEPTHVGRGAMAPARAAGEESPFPGE